MMVHAVCDLSWGSSKAWRLEVDPAMTSPRLRSCGSAQMRSPLMNQYGRFAEQSWQMLAPARYAALEDPNHFFSTLGQEAQTRVVWLAEQMQGPDPTGETYWEKVGRLNAIRMQAEEIVRAEMLTPEPETLEEDDDENAGFDPQTSSILQLLMETHHAIHDKTGLIEDQ